MAQRSGTCCAPVAEPRARDVVGDVLARSAGITGSSVWWRTRVGTRTVGSTARTSTSATRGSTRAKVAGLAARRSIRAQVARISSFHGMSGLITRWCFPFPTWRPRRRQIPRRRSISAFNHRVGVALEPDQRGCSGRMCGCEQRRRRKRAINCDEDRLLTSEILSTAVMLSAHCSGSAARPASPGSDAPVSRKR